MSTPTDTQQPVSINADFVEVPAIAAPYLADAVFLDVPGVGWQRILDVYTDCETDCVFAVCGDPRTGAYTRYYRTFYSETERVICAAETIPLEVFRAREEALEPVDELVVGFARGDEEARLREGLPGECVEIGGTVWEREQPSAHRYRWVQELDPDQYDWDSDEDDVSLVGVETPIRAVSLDTSNAEWMVQAMETAGPNYYRPGYTEPIGSKFTEETDRAEVALATIEQYLETLS